MLGVRHRAPTAASDEQTAMAPSPAVHIIDDDDAVRNSLAILLETHGLSVATYGSAREFLERRPVAAGCCVVTDVQMAGIDGLDLLRALKSVDEKIPVIVITARAERALAARAMDGGAAAFIEKPFGPEAFVALIRTTLEGGGRP